ncbi:MAG: hypothetical protein A3K10_15630 [Bacteroidetes bacterium RIFCSPLOWO2_12_FULL_31_6]|nr:MAG: hypothetical protein A3K10_15630 [Bacteroidetes bacterium RIFCSPLOWO2_12_FULL_31_6]
MKILLLRIIVYFTKYILLFLILNLLIINHFKAQNDSILYENSVELYGEKKYKKALIEINKAIGINDKKAIYVSFKGQILFKINKDTDEFFTYLTKATEIEPNSPLPLIERAYYYEKINEYQNAILDYNDALKKENVDSTLISVYVNRGGVLLKLQKPDLAYEDLSKAYKIDSNNMGVLNNLAMCLEDLGKRKESNKLFLKMITIDSLFFPAWMNLGFQASLKGDYVHALAYLNKANELDPNQPYTLNNRGFVKLNIDDIEGALIDINKSLELDPNNSYAYRNKALLYLKKNDIKLVCENLHLAKKYGFTIYFGEEVDKLIKQHCIK